MMQCNRFYTDLSFKKRIIINSCSLRNLKWGAMNNDDGRKSLIEPTPSQSLYNNSVNVKVLSSSNSTEKNKKNIITNEEKEQKRKEEMSRKREMSYRARKRIILRMKGTQDNKEQKKEQEREKEKETNKRQKIRKIEIKFPADTVKFKRVNSNLMIGYNSSNFNNKDYEILDKYNSSIENKNGANSIIDNINTDNNDKILKNNFVFYRNIRNIYKKNLVKDISVFGDKNNKLLKVKNNSEKNNATFNGEKINMCIGNMKKNSILYKEKKEKINNDESKNDHFENKVKNNRAMIKYLKNQKNKKSLFDNLDSKADNDVNDIYYSLNSSKRNLTRINSDFVQNQNKFRYFDNNESGKKTEFNNNSKNILNNNIDSNNKVRRKRNENSEKKNLYNFSFFNNFQTKKNKFNLIKEEGEELKFSDNNKNFKLDTHKNKTYKKDIMNKNINRKLNMINLKILPNDHMPNNNKYNSIENDYFGNKKYKVLDKKFFMIHFFEELIDISNSMDNRSLLATLLNNFNQKYYVINDKSKKDYLYFYKENENFEYIFKHFGLVIICLIFLSKDEVLYNTYFVNVKELLIQLIYSSLNYVEIDGNKESNKIYNFININNYQAVIPNHRYILSLIYLLFDNKKEYLPLKDALEQVHNIITKKDLQFIIQVINDSILFCYNSKPKCFFNFPFFAFKNNVLTIKNNQDKQNNDINYTNYASNNYSCNNNITSINNNFNNLSSNNIPNNINNITANNIPYKNNENFTPTAPFIKSPMRKKFCLVLDIDETISHSLKLSFGCYFLLRPGTKIFLKEVSKYYEIIIFTSSPKKYADKILNKIDIDGNLISHRLYRTHVLYENGKSVKNLNLIGRDLTKTIFVDNLRSNAKYNLNNLCPITTWRSDIFDDRLIKLKDKLIYIATCGKYDDDITQGL